MMMTQYITLRIAILLIGTHLSMAFNGVLLINMDQKTKLIKTHVCLDDSTWINDPDIKKELVDNYRSDIFVNDFEKIQTHTDYKVPALTIDQLNNKTGSYLTPLEYKAVVASILTLDGICILVYQEIIKNDVGGREFRRIDTAFHDMIGNPEVIIKVVKENWPDCSSFPPITAGENCGTYIGIDYEKSGFCTNILFCNKGRLEVNADTLDCFLDTKFDKDCGTGRMGLSFSVRKTPTPKNLGRHVIPSDVCSINGFQLKECEFSYMNDKTVGFIHYGNHHEFIWNFDGLVTDVPMDNIKAYKCSGCKGMECKDCRHGDEMYLRKFTIKTKNCSCSMQADTANYFFRHGSQVIPLTAFIQDVVKVEYEVLTETSKQKCQNCGVHCASGKLKIKEPSKMKLIKYCANGQCTQVSPRDEIELPISDLLLGRTYDVTTYYGIGNEKNFKVKCEVHELCDSIQCHMCFERYLNPTCYGFWEYSFIIFISTISSFGIVVCFGLIYLGNKACGIIKIPALIMKFLAVKCFHYTSPKIKNLAKKAKTKYDEMKKDDSSSNKLAEKIKLKTKKTKMPRFYATTIICICLAQAVTACSRTSYISSSGMQCISKEDGDVCSSTTTLEIPMATSGQSSCFFIEDDHSRPLGTLAISTLNTKLVCNKRTLYWTYTALPKLHKVYQCFAVAGCSSSESCRTFGKDKIYSGIDKGLAKKAGESGCIRVNGGWANGCGLFEDACVIYRLQMANKYGNYYEVFDCPEYTWSIDVTVTTVLNNQSNTQEHNLIIGSEVETAMGRLSLNGPSMIPIKETSDCFMVQNKKSMSKVNCNSLVEQTAGRVGEMKCPSETDAMEGSSNCFYSEGLVKLSRSGPELKMTGSVADVRKIHETGALPVSGGTHIFVQDGSNVELKLTGGTDFRLSLKMNDVRLIHKINIPKCAIEVEEMTGCYLCKEGSVAKAKIFASKPANVLITCKSFKQPIQLKEGTGSYEIRAHLITPVVKETCFLQCDERVEFSLEGKLYFSEVEDILHTNVMDLPGILSTATWSFALSLGWASYLGIIFVSLIALTSTFFVWRFIAEKRKGKMDKLV